MPSKREQDKLRFEAMKALEARPVTAALVFADEEWSETAHHLQGRYDFVYATTAGTRPRMVTGWGSHDEPLVSLDVVDERKSKLVKSYIWEATVTIGGCGEEQRKEWVHVVADDGRTALSLIERTCPGGQVAKLEQKHSVVLTM